MQLDVLIFGGGAAGLWLLDELTRRGARALLLEADRLGSGQTIASQGIIHGGLKYTLQGALTPSAVQIREMPALWRDCLAGDRSPDLSRVRLRTSACHLWRTHSLGSRLGMIGARVGLRVAPQVVADDERPPALARCPGVVARLEETVLAPESLLETLFAENAKHVLSVATSQVQIACAAPANVRDVRISDPQTGAVLNLVPRHVVLAAGRGNAELRRRCGLAQTAMQTRPLHMVLVRGDLPLLNGHCVDGRTTRVTITSDRDVAGRTVWQVGGQIAEVGVQLDERSLLARAADELRAAIPGIDLSEVEWASYRVDRAEQSTAGAARPESVGVLCEGNVITAWPTKLALVPYLAERILEYIGPIEADSHETGAAETAICDAWTRPQIALLPWVTPRPWFRTGELGHTRRREAA
ncbi:MAG TPA: FAD-dependent oxidoreductase [Planctomycetaceae bacterium]|jgi:glycerol-3-phosphate dehydrogenase|nr:FAD-dependent oxidoreductase [Planctomycetaceae bacterium]